VLLVIKQRPASLDSGCPFLDARIMAAFGDPISIARLPFSGAIVRAAPLPPGVPPAPGERPRAAPRAPDPATPVVVGANGATTVMPAPLVPNVPMPAPNAFDTPDRRNVFVFSRMSAPMVVAGATIVRTNADLRETFGVKSGVLVLDVARGSPAYSSGLRGGDVIVSAGRIAVESPLSIQRAIETADGTELPLRIIRKKKAQSLTLRW